MHFLPGRHWGKALRDSLVEFIGKEHVEKERKEKRGTLRNKFLATAMARGFPCASYCGTVNPLPRPTTPRVLYSRPADDDAMQKASGQDLT